MKAVILAAGIGKRLKDAINNLPKAFVPIEGKPLIEYSLDNLKKVGIKEIFIVVGYKESLFKKNLGKEYKGINIRYAINKNYASTGNMFSFSKIEGLIDDDILLLDSDILYEFLALEKLIKFRHKDAILIAPASGSGDEVFVCVDKEGYVTNLGKNIQNKEEAVGEFVGITKLSPELLKHVYANAKKDYARNETNYNYEECVFNTSKIYPIKGLFIKDLVWTEIDTKNDLIRMRKTFSKINQNTF